MLRIDEGKIYLTRGDTAYLDILITLDDGANYVPTDGDKIYFSVKQNLDDTEYALQKEVAAGETIILMPADTNSLPIGKYWYDVQLNTAIGEVFTVIEKSAFYLREEVTDHE